MKKVIIKVNGSELVAELKDTNSANEIYNSLPIEGNVNVWGDEIYFMIPVCAELEPDAREVVEVGDLAYWPSGPAFCVFWGPTPVSEGDEPRAYNPVNVFGKVISGLEELKGIRDGSSIIVKKL